MHQKHRYKNSPYHQRMCKTGGNKTENVRCPGTITEAYEVIILVDVIIRSLFFHTLLLSNVLIPHICRLYDLSNFEKECFLTVF